ncbi:MAG: hypothetical protein KKD29_06210 [Candidatus Omnitrophica bacterium]|nr:hypothetical protein [Candidatus Omnitrophota bacterium]MBU4488389.1 hypothetical protein [Candidatus Omnitrophota bacterium]MCG2705024.1 hypothetical protein [Candidatus Omnitrophota bacterium]
MRPLRAFLILFLMLSFIPFAYSGFEYPVIEDPATEPPGGNPPVNEYFDENLPPNIAPPPATKPETPRKSNPRIMVITVEYVDGIEQPASMVQAKMEKEFLANNFPLVDKSQMEMIKERDAVLSFSDPDRAAALGRNYGAEIVVVVEAKSNMTDTSQPYGVTVYTYECDATAKAVKTDTAEVITSDSASATERGSGRIPTANKACEKAISEIAASIVEEIKEEIGGDAYNETTIQIVCSNADYTKAKEFIEALDEQRSIKAVHERSVERNVAIIDVVLLGNADFLADLLEEMQNGPLVRITAKSAHRIDLEFVE